MTSTSPAASRQSSVPPIRCQPSTDPAARTPPPGPHHPHSLEPRTAPGRASCATNWWSFRTTDNAGCTKLESYREAIPIAGAFPGLGSWATSRLPWPASRPKAPPSGAPPAVATTGEHERSMPRDPRAWWAESTAQVRERQDEKIENPSPISLGRGLLRKPLCPLGAQAIATF